MIKSGGSFELDGGTANNVMIEADGSAAVYLGASLNNTTLTSARLRVTSKAVAENTTVSSGGTMSVSSGGTANHTFVNFSAWMFVEESGIASNTTVSSGGSMCVAYEAEAHGLTVSDGGSATVRNNASADDVTICGSGSLYVYSGGVLADATVLTGGIMVVSSGGILTGSQTYATGADVSVVDGGGFVFDVSGLTAADCANPFLNNLALVTGNPTFTLAVSNVQSFGTYTLADWADGFDKPVTVVNDAWEDTGITLEVGVSKDIFGASHSLQVIGARLVLIVGESENMEPADNGWNDTLYDKKSKKVNERVYGMDALAVTADTRELLIDTAGTVRALDDMHNFIGNSPSSGRLDAADFTKIELATAAKLSFNAYSGQAAKFTVWQLTEGKDKKGATTYTMKSLQSATLKGGYAGVSTSKKPLLLEAGTYYVSMELSNAKKAGEDGYYSVTIDDSPSATEFYTRADNSDDWEDMKENGQSGRHFGSLGVLSDNSFDEGFLVSDGWVGFGDAVDYMQFTVESAAKLGFYIGATDATKFTVWQLNEKNGKNGVTTYSLKSLQSVTLKKEGEYNYYADTYDKPVTLAAGTYYMSVESTNAKKGGSAAYTVELASFVESDSLSAALAMPEADALADVAAIDKFAALDDASAWQSLLA